MEANRNLVSNSNSRSNPEEDLQLFLATSYTAFDHLAHGPKGREAEHSLRVYGFNDQDGSLLLLNIAGDKVLNPAFCRYHPKFNVVYTCTESVIDDGQIFAYRISSSGELEQLGEPISARGTSTCYLTFDHDLTTMVAVNYWDSTLISIELDPQTGRMLHVNGVYDPKGGKKMVAPPKKMGGVNHSNNNSETIKERQADPHSHALVFDNEYGVVAYVPDLGKDLIREFYYDRTGGKIEMEFNVLPSGLCTGHADGPRYFEFHPDPSFNVAYVVNELSSTIAVFEVDKSLLREMDAASRNGEDMNQFKGRSTLRLVQSIKTIPSAFPTSMNTCGRICVHRSGRFVIVSNRGHQSICVYKVKMSGPKRGELRIVDYFHTRGQTPRHFQFDHSGQYLLVANQDTDSIAVFSFNLSTGQIRYTGNQYDIPSPNFLCCCPVNSDSNELPAAPQAVASTVGRQLSTGSSVVSESDESVSTEMLTDVSKASDNDLKKELSRAHAEIAELKRLLSAKI